MGEYYSPVIKFRRSTSITALASAAGLVLKKKKKFACQVVIQDCNEFAKIAILRCLKTHLNVGVEPQKLAGRKLVCILRSTESKKFPAQTGFPRERIEKTEISRFKGSIYLYVCKWYTLFSNFANLNSGE